MTATIRLSGMAGQAGCQELLFSPKQPRRENDWTMTRCSAVIAEPREEGCIYSKSK